MIASEFCVSEVFGFVLLDVKFVEVMCYVYARKK